MKKRTNDQEQSKVYAIDGNVVDRASAKNGKGWCEDVAPTLNTQDRHAVCIAIECNGSRPSHMGKGFNTDGKTMSNDFQKNLTDANVEKELLKRMREMQPGDDVTFVINLRNDYSKTTNWYMTNKIVSSLEEGTAKNGAYSYHLWYKTN